MKLSTILNETLNLFENKFNYTRISWSKGYKCNYRKIDEANILIISGTFISATTLFYLALRLLYKKE
jgi:hypothetical protein